MNKEISIDGKKLSYSVYGNGKPVVLLHGFGEEASVWDQQVDFLKDRFQLIVPQLPGTGGSALIDDMSMEGMAGAIKQLLDAEGLDRVDMIGHSMGGYITLAFAEKYPGQLNGLGLFHSSAYPDSEEKKEARRKGIAFIEQNGAAAFLETATPNLFSSKTKNERPGLIKQQLADIDSFSPESLIAYYRAMMQRPNRTGILKTAKVPVLFIIGTEDNAIPMKDILEQTHLPAISHIHILKDCGHMGMLEWPLESNHALTEFLVS